MPAVLTVLHIDDDPDTRFLLQELARQAEIEAGDSAAIRWLAAGGIAEALARYSKSSPDVILLDHLLDGESGLDLLPSVQCAWSCPVWILTGFSPQALRELAAKAGAAGVIPKDELLANATGLRNLLLACCGSGPHPPMNR